MRMRLAESELMNIEIHNLSKKYGRQYALNHIDLKLENGVYGLLGVNGAGKTTLLNIFMGILKADTGNVYLDGMEVSKLGKEFLDKIGYLPQFPQFYKEFSVYEFMSYMCALKGVGRKDSKDRIHQLIAEVNLADNLHKKVGALSGGMRQRLGIAQAMINDPEILILDEPTAGLDPQERIRFRNLISKFSMDKVVLLATHIVSDVEYIANRVIIMNQGKVVQEGTIEELEASLEGKVWELNGNVDQTILSNENNIISNMKRTEHGTAIRVIFEHEKPPSYLIGGSGEVEPEANVVRANLDDVFLYYCKGDS